MKSCGGFAAELGFRNRFGADATPREERTKPHSHSRAWRIPIMMWLAVNPSLKRDPLCRNSTPRKSAYE